MSTRKQQIADAALAVLAAEGARGLTHRAVDREAGMPQGSASNYFRTRESLLAGALARHAELDTPPAMRDGTDATAAVLAALRHILEPARRPLVAARYELFLEATRRPGLHAEVGDARARFVGFARALLEAEGCGTPEVHARQLVALLDGVLVDQLLATPTTLDEAAIEDLVRRFLAGC